MYSTQPRGVALTELAMILPVLLIIFLGGFEFIRILKTYESLSNIVREAGNLAFRQCALVENPQLCFEDSHSQSQALITNLLPNASLTLSMYRYAPATPPAPHAELVLQWPANGSSKYDAQIVSTHLNCLNNRNETIVIGEVHYTFNSSFPLVAEFFNGRILYDSIIY